MIAAIGSLQKKPPHQILWYCNIPLGVENIMSDMQNRALLLSSSLVINDLKSKLTLCGGPDTCKLDYLDS